MQRGAILPRLILDLVPTTECLSIIRFGHLCRLSSFYLHLGRLCSSRVWSFDHGAPPAVVYSVLSDNTSDAPLQVLQETSDAPLKVITAPHPSAGTTPRSLSAHLDSTVPDSALPNAPFSSPITFFWNRGRELWRADSRPSSLRRITHFVSSGASRPSAIISFGMQCSVDSYHVIPLDETHLCTYPASPLPRLLRSSTGRPCDSEFGMIGPW
jgi:hypothetical protein